MEKKFLNIEYLSEGTARQQRAYRVLKRSGIFESLKSYDPLLAGTVPISIDLPESDLDIICHLDSGDAGRFVRLLSSLYGSMPGFDIRTENDVVVCNFIAESESIEIYASPVPTHLSRAFIHMIVEERLLRLGGENFRGRIIALKKSGLKTEPAFAEMLALNGDPYEEIVHLVNTSDAELKKMLRTGC